MRQRDTGPGAGLALGMMALLAIALAVIVLSGQFVQVRSPDYRPDRQPGPAIARVEGVVSATKLSAAAAAAIRSTWQARRHRRGRCTRGAVLTAQAASALRS